MARAERQWAIGSGWSADRLRSAVGLRSATAAVTLMVSAACVTPAGGGGGAAGAVDAPEPSGGGMQVEAADPEAAQKVEERCPPGEAMAAGDDRAQPQVEIGVSGVVDEKTGKTGKIRPYAGHRCK